jgi:hypothetical protein
LSSSGATGQPRSVALPSTTGCPQSPESGASSRPDGCAESASHRPSFDGGPCLLCGAGGLSRRGGLPCVLPGGTPPVAGDGALSRVFVPPTAVTFDPGPALSGRPSVCCVRDREVPPTRISLRRVRAHTSRRRPANAPGFIPGHRHASGASTHVSGHLPWVRNVVGDDGALTGGGLCRGLARPLGALARLLSARHQSRASVCRRTAPTLDSAPRPTSGVDRPAEARAIALSPSAARRGVPGQHSTTQSPREAPAGPLSVDPAGRWFGTPSTAGMAQSSDDGAAVPTPSRRLRLGPARARPSAIRGVSGLSLRAEALTDPPTAG